MFLAYVFTLAPLASLAGILALAGGSVGGIPGLALPGEVENSTIPGPVGEPVVGTLTGPSTQEDAGLMDARVTMGLHDTHALPVVHEPVGVVGMGILGEPMKRHEEQEQVDDTLDHVLHVVR